MNRTPTAAEIAAAHRGEFTAEFTCHADAAAFAARLGEGGFWVTDVKLNRANGRTVTFTATEDAYSCNRYAADPDRVQGIAGYWADMTNTVGHYGSAPGEYPDHAGAHTAYLNGRPARLSTERRHDHERHHLGPAVSRPLPTGRSHVLHRPRAIATRGMSAMAATGPVPAACSRPGPRCATLSASRRPTPATRGPRGAWPGFPPASRPSRQRTRTRAPTSSATIPPTCTRTRGTPRSARPATVTACGLGRLGRLDWYRCRSCGIDFSQETRS